MTMLLINVLVLFVLIAAFMGFIILCIHVGFHLGWWLTETVSKLKWWK